jgi:hypothetical protein
MDQRLPEADLEDDLSPYRTFAREEWARLRADTPLTLTADEVLRLQSLNDPISLDEVIAIYLPLSRLLSLYVAATQGLFKATQRFLLAENERKVPYIIGVAGSVAVGQIDDSSGSQGAPGPVAKHAQGRSGHDGRLSPAERRTGSTWFHGTQGLPGKL